MSDPAEDMHEYLVRVAGEGAFIVVQPTEDPSRPLRDPEPGEIDRLKTHMTLIFYGRWPTVN